MKQVDGVIATKKRQKKITKEVAQISGLQLDENGNKYVSWDLNQKQNKKISLYVYITIAALTLLTAAYFAYILDWFAVVVVIIFSGVIIWYLKYLRDQKTSLAISRLGIKIGETFYSYPEIYYFSIGHFGDGIYLQFVLTKKYLPLIQVEITDLNVNYIRKLLLKKLPEHSVNKENVIDMAVRILGL